MSPETQHQETLQHSVLSLYVIEDIPTVDHVDSFNITPITTLTIHDLSHSSFSFPGTGETPCSNGWTIDDQRHLTTTATPLQETDGHTPASTTVTQNQDSVTDHSGHMGTQLSQTKRQTTYDSSDKNEKEIPSLTRASSSNCISFHSSSLSHSDSPHTDALLQEEVLSQHVLQDLSICNVHTPESCLLQIQDLYDKDLNSTANKHLFLKASTSLDALLDSTETPTTNQVVNLSSRVLNEHQFSVLSKGLNFCPTPGEPKRGDLVRDPAHRNLEAFIFLNERDLNHQRFMEPRMKNLSREEKKALRELKQDPSITIKGADKGGAVVIMDTKDYVAEADRQLADRDFYLPMPQDQTQEFSDCVSHLFSTSKSFPKGSLIGLALDNPRHHPFTLPLKSTNLTHIWESHRGDPLSPAMVVPLKRFQRWLIFASTL